MSDYEKLYSNINNLKDILGNNSMPNTTFWTKVAEKNQPTIDAKGAFSLADEKSGNRIVVSSDGTVSGFNNDTFIKHIHLNNEQRKAIVTNGESVMGEILAEFNNELRTSTAAWKYNTEDMKTIGEQNKSLNTGSPEVGTQKQLDAIREPGLSGLDTIGKENEVKHTKCVDELKTIGEQIKKENKNIDYKLLNVMLEQARKNSEDYGLKTIGQQIEDFKSNKGCESTLTTVTATLKALAKSVVETNSTPEAVFNFTQNNNFTEMLALASFANDREVSASFGTNMQYAVLNNINNIVTENLRHANILNVIENFGAGKEKVINAINKEIQRSNESALFTKVSSVNEVLGTVDSLYEESTTKLAKKDVDVVVAGLCESVSELKITPNEVINAVVSLQPKYVVAKLNALNNDNETAERMRIRKANKLFNVKVANKYRSEDVAENALGYLCDLAKKYDVPFVKVAQAIELLAEAPVATEEAVTALVCKKINATETKNRTVSVTCDLSDLGLDSNSPDVLESAKRKLKDALAGNFDVNEGFSFTTFSLSNDEQVTASFTESASRPLKVKDVAGENGILGDTSGFAQGQFSVETNPSGDQVSIVTAAVINKNKEIRANLIQKYAQMNPMMGGGMGGGMGGDMSGGAAPMQGGGLGSETNPLTALTQEPVGNEQEMAPVEEAPAEPTQDMTNKYEIQFFVKIVPTAGGAPEVSMGQPSVGGNPFDAATPPADMGAGMPPAPMTATASKKNLEIAIMRYASELNGNDVFRFNKELKDNGLTLGDEEYVRTAKSVVSHFPPSYICPDCSSIDLGRTASKIFCHDCNSRFKVATVATDKKVTVLLDKELI